MTNGRTDKRTNAHRWVSRKRDKRTNGQTDKRTGGKNGDITDGRTDGLTESCFLR